VRDAGRAASTGWPAANAAHEPDRKGFSRRMLLYLREMFPVLPRLSMAALLYSSFAGVLARLHRWPTLTLRDLLLGTWSVFAMMLVLRLMDELKDLDVDRRLFASRPVPSGRVLESDVRVSLLVVAGLYVAAHVGAGPSLWTALAVLGYAVLMFLWFFVPGLMRPRLLLTLATHNPIIPLLLVHLAGVAALARGRGHDLDANVVLPLVAVYWMPLFAWEIARKIRAPEEENDYVTYSRLLGPTGAVVLAAGAQTIALGLGWWLAHVNGFRPGWFACAGAGWAIAQAAHARFLLRPGPTTSRLRPFAELFLAALLAAGFFA
jgi:4-hydroxybenzoate polyprenyltransferase